MIDYKQIRYKVIADYPCAIHKVGDIIPTYESAMSYAVQIDDVSDKICMSDYPHLFKKLEWWEGRSESELPKYFRYKDSISAYRGVTHYSYYRNLVDVDIMVWNDAGYGAPAKECLPATEDEYLEYKKKFE